MLNISGASQKVQIVTDAAADVRVAVSYWDADVSASPATIIGPGSPSLLAAISTATTTDVVATVGANKVRNVTGIQARNNHASTSVNVTAQVTDGTSTEVLAKVALLPGESLILDEAGMWWHLSSGGAPYSAVATPAITYNASTTSQGAGFASDTYLTGSNILIPSVRPKVGTKYRCRFQVTKTAAGTATPIIQLRYGTNASTADTSLCSFTFGAGTAAADSGIFEVTGLFRSVGTGTSAVIAGNCTLLNNLTTTGLSNAVKSVQTTSSGFDSTTANTYLGVSVNGGASASWTVQIVEAQIENIV